MKNFSYDYSGMLAETIGKHGVPLSTLKKLSPTLRVLHESFLKSLDSDTMAFHRLPDEHTEIKNILRVSRDLKKKFENLVVIGIGGSDLGAQAVIGALTSQYHNELPSRQRKGMRIYFCGDTTDPQPLTELISLLDFKKTAFHVVSKSGNTIETMTAFMILKEALKKKVGKSYSRHIVATTSPTSGQLIKLVKQEGYTLLPHGPVGGRFSVLSSVGLLAIACAGIDVQQLLFGADSLREYLEENTATNNAPFVYAALHYHGFLQGKNISVLMPYDYKLKKFGAWYRQLWAESLGKHGKGQTPVAALGPTDQHSQLQLYQEGPRDKQITFIVTKEKNDLTTPAMPISAIRYFGKKKLLHILHEEHATTAASLLKDDRPQGTITLNELTPYSVGQLIYFFELATAYSGALYKLNAFDQPGVEQSKNFLHASLGNKELAPLKKDLERLRKHFGKYTA